MHVSVDVGRSSVFVSDVVCCLTGCTRMRSCLRRGIRGRGGERAPPRSSPTVTPAQAGGPVGSHTIETGLDEAVDAQLDLVADQPYLGRSIRPGRARPS